MKKFLFSAVFPAITLMAVHHATATPIPAVHGPLTIAWTINQQNLDGAAKFPGTGKTNISGAATGKTTNVLQIYTFSFTNATLNNASLLKLLGNSLNTTFPAGTELVTDGSNLYVSDHTGTNAIADISSILTVTTSNNVFSGLDTTTQKYTTSGTSSTDLGTSSGKQFVIVNYNDSGLTTTDGTTTTFTFVGVSAYTSSGSTTVSIHDVWTVKESGSFRVNGSGYGNIRGQASIIEGTILGTSSGTETITVP
jgi:hypothetical protein